MTLAWFVNNVPVILTQFEGVGLPEWIDTHGHGNLADYVVLFDQATDAARYARGVAGISRQDVRSGAPHLLRALGRRGQRVRVVPSVLGADTKRLHYFHEMFHAGGGNRIAPQELMVMHIDMSARPAAAFPADLLETISAALRACREQAVPKSVGRRKAIPG